ncbi:MAG: hypothetical protein ACLTIL_03135 [[Eubacterium] siraeum]
MSRKKGFKVKRSRRNLYKKRKSTGRKIFDGILFVVILGAFVFVGYSVASPLIKFFGGNGDNSSVSEPAWTPPESLPETRTAIRRRTLRITRPTTQAAVIQQRITPPQCQTR